jgi:photosystem II stability/assembly factor-like uncharacterized protein
MAGVSPISPSPTLLFVKLWTWALVLTLPALGRLAYAQWQIENSTTTADLRGIDNVGGGIAWASGTNGTVLRTEDGGYLWQPCTVPPGAEHLDFRGIQAFDANTAIVMSSGKGDLSRLYKTTDGCQTWKLIFTDPDKDGFWDALIFSCPSFGTLIGDTVHKHFPIYYTANSGESWQRMDDKRIFSTGESIFAASNSALVVDPDRPKIYFVAGGKSATAVEVDLNSSIPSCKNCESVGYSATGLATGKTAGAFSLARDGNSKVTHFVVVGGDYEKPDNPDGTASFWTDDYHGNFRWDSAATPPHGFRSAVAYDADLKTWITVGPNGTDVSTDDGKNWRAVHPDPALHETPDADRNWNALSLPFVVGPHGRIGKLDAPALAH